jgi:hypothetical protein
MTVNDGDGMGDASASASAFVSDDRGARLDGLAKLSPAGASLFVIKHYIQVEVRLPAMIAA